jgi:uncharacterized spore protein YtfJ
LRRR